MNELALDVLHRLFGLGVGDVVRHSAANEGLEWILALEGGRLALAEERAEETFEGVGVLRCVLHERSVDSFVRMLCSGRRFITSLLGAFAVQFGVFPGNLVKKCHYF